MKRILLVFGTRPEAIKMAPLVKEFLNHREKFDTKVCITAQHRQMLDQVLSFFGIEADYDLNLMRPDQSLFRLTAGVLVGLKSVIEEFHPDVVLVHGDTTTSTAAALAAFYAGVKVGHVEAGLRTYNKRAPFPEEINRQLTSRIADFNFTPTLGAKQNLIGEKIVPATITVTGNTVIDSLMLAREKLKTYSDDEIERLKKMVDLSKKVIVVTGHRRENFGDGFLNICDAVRQVARLHEDVQIIYPVHMNPNVQRPVYELLAGLPNVKLIAPLAYPAFVWLMTQSYMILTDSGGIQEEAPSLGKPVLVMRDVTERPEAVEAGTVKMVGTDKEKIVAQIEELLVNPSLCELMSKAHNPYGDGQACRRIVEIFENATL